MAFLPMSSRPNNVTVKLRFSRRYTPALVSPPIRIKGIE